MKIPKLVGLVGAIVVALAANGIAARVTFAIPEAADSATAPEYATGSLLVRFRAGTPPADRANVRASVGAEMVREFDLVPGLEHLRLNAGGLGVEEAVKRLSSMPFVEYAEPDYVVRAAATPNDPYYGNLWGLANIKAPIAWDKFTGSPSFVVAIIDTGIDLNHPDLAANIWTNPGEIAGNGIDDDHNGYVDDIHGWDFSANDNDPFDGNGHGTQLAGTMGAVGNNGIGIVGVNWNVKLMPLKFMADDGSGTIAAAISALNYAVAKGARISNNSWLSTGYEQSTYDAIRAARDAGHLFVAAAGNNGVNTDTTPIYPAAYDLDNIISVAAITSSDALASYSNYGAFSVDLAAPGSNIYSTRPGNTYGTSTGGSYAAAHVTGVAALIWGKDARLSWSQVKSRILNTARPLASLTGKTVSGGTLDAAAALSSLSAPVYLPLLLRQAPGGLAAPVLDAIAPPEDNPSYTVRWSAVAGATSYVLERATGPAFGDAVQVYTGPATETIAASAGITVHHYRVKARGAAGDSAWSNVQAVEVRWELEPNDLWDKGAGGPLVSGQDYYGYPNDSSDYFYLYVNQAGSMTLQLRGHSGQGVQTVVYAGPPPQDGNPVICAGSPDCEKTFPVSAGQYYIRIYAESGHNAAAPYTLRVTYP